MNFLEEHFLVAKRRRDLAGPRLDLLLERLSRGDVLRGAYHADRLSGFVDRYLTERLNDARFAVSPHDAVFAAERPFVGERGRQHVADLCAVVYVDALQEEVERRCEAVLG